MPFVKSKGTDVPVVRSQAEIQRILRRYGATHFGTQSSYEEGVIRVFFRIPDSPKPGAPIVPIRLEGNIRAVAAACGWDRPTQAGLEQAERIAWRHLVLWVDAACSAAAAGLQTMGEAFFAHVLVAKNGGGAQRIIEEFEERGGFLALPAPKDSEQ